MSKVKESERQFEQTQVTKAFSQEDVETFAELSGDENPLHLDQEYAEGTKFDGTLVHGALVNSLISAALAKLPGNIIYAQQEANFYNPVYPDQELVATAKVTDKSGKFWNVETTVTNNIGETVVGGSARVISENPPVGFES